MNDLAATSFTVATERAPLRLAVDASGRVLSIAPGDAEPAGDEIATLGLVDLQVNGFAGIDFNAPDLTPAQFDLALRAMAARGVGQCLPTLITAPIERLEQCFLALERARAASPLARAMVAGYHLEGPFLSPAEGYRGCHPAEAMGPADIAAFDRLNRAAGDRIRLLTVAPEIPGVMALIAHASARGILVALGHTAADRGTVDAAVKAGARLSTHLGNGCPGVLPRNDNVVLNQLAEDGLFASFIADGLHIPPSTLRVYLRAKTLERSVLVTDATAGAAAAAGNYRLGPIAIRALGDGSVRELESPRLAGSALTLDTAVANVAEWLSLPLGQAVALARDHALTALGDPVAPETGKPVAIVQWKKDGGRWRVRECRIGAERFALA